MPLFRRFKFAGRCRNGSAHWRRPDTWRLEVSFTRTIAATPFVLPVRLNLIQELSDQFLLLGLEHAQLIIPQRRFPRERVSPLLVTLVVDHELALLKTVVLALVFQRLLFLLYLQKLFVNVFELLRQSEYTWVLPRPHTLCCLFRRLVINMRHQYHSRCWYRHIIGGQPVDAAPMVVLRGCHHIDGV